MKRGGVLFVLTLPSIFLFSEILKTKPLFVDTNAGKVGHAGAGEGLLKEVRPIEEFTDSLGWISKTEGKDTSVSG